MIISTGVTSDYIVHVYLFLVRKYSGSYLDKQLASMPPHQGDDWASMHGYRSMLINDDDTRSLASTSVSRPRGRAARGG